VYVQPEEPLYDRYGKALPALRELRELLSSEDFAVAVVDGVTEAMATEGLSLMDNAEIAHWNRRLPKLLASTGAAVVQIDHVPKDASTRGSIGGQHKLAGLTGAAYKFDTVRYFSRPVLEPTEGTIALTVEKDRPGYVRSGALDGGRVGMLRLEGRLDGSVRARIDPPTQRPAVNIAVVARVARHLQTYPRSSQRRIEENVQGNARSIRETLAWMVENDLVEVEPSGRSHLHSLRPDVALPEGVDMQADLV
jgi:hypothetical protein